MDSPRKARRRPLARWAGTALAGLAALCGGLHLYAGALDGIARESALPAATRAAAIERARSLEPWNERFVATAAIVEAQALLGEGGIDEAYFRLLPYSRTVRGDELFRETYQEVVAEKWVLDSRKAHVQHGREKEGGRLEPEDVMR